MLGEGDRTAFPGLGLLHVVPAVGVAERPAHGYRAVIAQVRPAKRADLASAHTGGEGELYGHAERGVRLRAHGEPKHAGSLLPAERVYLGLHALGRLAEVAGILGQVVLCDGELERLLEEAERLLHRLGCVAFGGHVRHPLAHVGAREVAKPYVAQVAAHLPRLRTVALYRAGLYGAALLLVVDERLEILAHGGGRPARAALDLKVDDQLVAGPLGLAPGLRLDRVVGGDHLA